MFKLGSSEHDIQSSMEQLLLNKMVEVDPSRSKIESVLELLKGASNIFGKAGLYKEAQEVNELLNQLVQHQSGIDPDMDDEPLEDFDEETDDTENEYDSDNKLTPEIKKYLGNA